MRIIVQRVSQASVRVNHEVTGAIGTGILALVGITHSDGTSQVEWMAEKLLKLRIFPDAEGKMNRDVQEVEGGLLIVSQFTLYGSLQKGTRPSFIDAAHPTHAEPLYEALVGALKAKAPKLHVATGRFGAMMAVELVNDGPVTILLER